MDQAEQPRPIDVKNFSALCERLEAYFSERADARLTRLSIFLVCLHLRRIVSEIDSSTDCFIISGLSVSSIPSSLH